MYLGFLFCECLCPTILISPTSQLNFLFFTVMDVDLRLNHVVITSRVWLSLLSSNIVLFLSLVVEIFHRPIIVFTINLMRK